MKQTKNMFGVLALSLLLSSCSCQSEKKEVVEKKAVTEKTEAVEKKKTIEKKGTPTMERTKSGLRYEINKEAPEGAAKPQAGQMVEVDYTGWLNEGEDKEGAKFDSSVDRGEPLVFTAGVGQVIPGWDETLLDMKVGEKRRIYIPSELGYGERGAGGVIPPNADLIFDVELHKIK
ncbi:MAG TPA: FKBP-type peptidyl-prolyl cis-trans isomerase [Candidatus Babeliales bacterium]|nr:FKBP-type peptidyl-prolyl cis-trans isomerase [Candidatus Babeliales bacterium]